MRRVALFVYGSLLAPRVVRSVIGRVPRQRPARLLGYRRDALRGYPFPGLLPDAGARTDGAVIEVSPAELARLDRYEDDFYARRRVAVALDGGGTLPAWTYVLQARYRRLATGRAWRIVCRGGL